MFQVDLQQIPYIVSISLEPVASSNIHNVNRTIYLDHR
jgi:hypothetical protein